LGAITNEQCTTCSCNAVAGNLRWELNSRAVLKLPLESMDCCSYIAAIKEGSIQGGGSILGLEEFRALASKLHILAPVLKSLEDENNNLGSLTVSMQHYH
jgi:hypothetical protein